MKETVKTPSGTFKLYFNRRFSETNFIGDSEIGSIGIKIISKEWYSKKVGLIKWNELKQLILIYLVHQDGSTLKTIRNTDETNKLSNNFFFLIIILYFGKFLLLPLFLALFSILSLTQSQKIL